MDAEQIVRTLNIRKNSGKLFLKEVGFNWMDLNLSVKIKKGGL